MPRQREIAEKTGFRRSGEDREGIGADGVEADDTGVEEAGLSPLQVEAERRDGEDKRHDGEEDQIGQDPDHLALTLARLC